MKKFIKCQDENGKVIMVATDTRTQVKLQRQGFPVILAGEEDLINAYITCCGFVREVKPETELSKHLAATGFKCKYQDKYIICLDKRGRRWAVCADQYTHNMLSTNYIAHKFIATIENDVNGEKEIEEGVYTATMNSLGNTSVLFIGLSVWAYPEDQLLSFCDIKGLEVME